jgi:hypothetical protein
MPTPGSHAGIGEVSLRSKPLGIATRVAPAVTNHLEGVEGYAPNPGVSSTLINDCSRNLTWSCPTLTLRGYRVFPGEVHGGRRK